MCVSPWFEWAGTPWISTEFSSAATHYRTHSNHIYIYVYTPQIIVLKLQGTFHASGDRGAQRADVQRYRYTLILERYIDTGLHIYCYAAKRKRGSKTPESMNTKSICSLHNLFQYKKKTSNSSGLCINDNLLEMSHCDPDSGFWSFG